MPRSMSRTGTITGLALAMSLGMIGGQVGAAHAATSATSDTTAHGPLAQTDPYHPDFGEHVLVLDPADKQNKLQSRIDSFLGPLKDAEFGETGAAVLLRPGTYGDAKKPVEFDLGYRTQVAGLGELPTDTRLNGGVEVHDRCLDAGGGSGCVASLNFDRSAANLDIVVPEAKKPSCEQASNTWAVSQGTSLRAVRISGAPLALTDECSNGDHWASGGFVADSALPEVLNGVQQQWVTRNGSVASWDAARYNVAFSGVDGAPGPEVDPAYTILSTTPVSREKPSLFLDSDGGYRVKVPAVRHDSTGTSWDSGSVDGEDLSLADFALVHPGDSTASIQASLDAGKHLLFTPGVHEITQTLHVSDPGTVVLGLGHPQLRAAGVDTVLDVADAPGIAIAGLTVQAGPEGSDVLVQVGEPGVHSGNTADPVSLSDVNVMVGGAQVGSTDTALRVDADGTLLDNVWLWRADHGQEGITDPTARWETLTAPTGLRVTGDDVHATGLFVEHFQKHNTEWSGERGSVLLYQNELPYDAPDQESWSRPGGGLGHPGYFVAPEVTEHTLDAGGVYANNSAFAQMITDNGFRTPEGPGIHLGRVMTTNFGAGTITHVINDRGEASDASNPGQAVVVDGR